MEIAKTKIPSSKDFTTIALTVMFSCFALFSLDRETHSIRDLFTPGNLAALVVYFLPAFLSSSLMFNLHYKKRDRNTSLLLSLIIGIPLSFTFVIFILLLLRR